MANRIHVVSFAIRRRFVAQALALSLLMSGCVDSRAQMNSEFKGVILDRVTDQPIEGAWVIAGYHEKIVSPAVVKQWCVRTKGMLTKTNGRFAFPIEKADGMSPASISAIKAGYYFDFAESEEDHRQRKKDAPSRGWVIYLSPQDEQKPRLRYGPEDKYCWHAKKSADVTASVEFLTIQLAEYRRLGVNETQIGAVEDMIDHLKRIERTQPGSINPKVKQ